MSCTLAADEMQRSRAADRATASRDQNAVTTVSHLHRVEASQLTVHPSSGYAYLLRNPPFRHPSSCAK